MSEVATYIDTKHHLPDIPAADEVKRNGIGLGEMEARLLAKIEELTLHAIEEHEGNERLREQNRSLETRIERLEGLMRELKDRK